jgi:serine/threonine protein kinase
MTLTAGTRLGPYEILAVLGVGGMGEVYRARDRKLHRDVAVKVLRSAVSTEPERLDRFEREAQILASLNHPNIGQIYGLEDAGGVRALIMELVEGPTLADRLVHGPIRVNEALDIARQIAEALEAAHAQGIVHRDLKPANVKVRDDSTVKVLDFGLAKMGEPTGTRAEMTKSPTLVASLPGTILGTAAYMSPEQAMGKPADGVSDVWSFGCVLYEMLAGRPAFDGEALAEVLGNVLKSEPGWERLPAETPAVIRLLLKRCLQKDRKHRLQHIGDARLEIEEAVRDPRPHSTTSTLSRRRTIAVAALGATILVAASAGLTRWASRDVSTPRELHLEISTPPSMDLASVAISPDGSMLAFVATSDVGSQLWIRRLSTGSSQPLAAAALATSPFWSPDSESIGFFAEGKLRRVDIESGAIQTLADTGFTSEGSWSQQGIIVFRPAATGPLSQVAATGGPVRAATRLIGGQTTHSAPQFLPDGRHFFFRSDGEQAGIYVTDLETGESRRNVEGSSTPVLLPSGYLLFVREGTLFGQPFDAGRLELTGTPSVVAQQVIAASVSASADGMIAFRHVPDDLALAQLAWVDRAGREIRRIGAPTTGASPTLSPDGRRVALSVTVDGNTDIYLLSTDDDRRTRLTFDPAADLHPIWSSDGSRVIFRSSRGLVAGLYEKAASGSGAEQLLVKAIRYAIPNDWSRDGRFLLFHGVVDERLQSETLALAMEGEAKAPVPLTEGPRDEGNAQFSANGKWIAYQSDEAGRFDIYLQPFTGQTGVTGKRQVSLPGGTHVGGAQPRWGKDDKELFYVASDGWLMAAPITLGTDPQTAEIGVPVPLFLARIGPPAQARSQYDVSLDGQQFLMNIRAFPDSPVSIIVNWKPKSATASTP